MWQYAVIDTTYRVDMQPNVKSRKYKDDEIIPMSKPAYESFKISQSYCFTSRSQNIRTPFEQDIKTIDVVVVVHVAHKKFHKKYATANGRPCTS